MPHYKQNSCFCLNWQLLLHFMPGTLRIKVHYSQNKFGRKHQHHYFASDDPLRTAFYFVYSTNACLQSKEGTGKKVPGETRTFVTGSPPDWMCDLGLSPELGFCVTSHRRRECGSKVYYNYVRFCIPNSQICWIVKSLKFRIASSLSTVSITVHQCETQYTWRNEWMNQRMNLSHLQ